MSLYKKTDSHCSIGGSCSIQDHRIKEYNTEIKRGLLKLPEQNRVSLLQSYVVLWGIEKGERKKTQERAAF
jgi:hypothetical protein